MNKLAAITVLALFSLASQIAAAADWNFAGPANDSKGRPVYQFYDAQTVTTSSDGSAKFWVQGILRDKIDTYFNKHMKTIQQVTAQKVMAGYRPNVLQLDRSRKKYKTDEDMFYESLAETAAEIIANSQDLDPSSRMYFEINCRNRQLRLLDGTWFCDGGKISGMSQGAGNWTDIAPDTNGDDWWQLFCKK